MRVLRFIVNGQKLTPDPACDFSGIVSNSRGYLVARFTFSYEWAGFKKVALFEGADPVPLKNNFCVIPAEALTGRTVRLSIVGQGRHDHQHQTTSTEFKRHRRPRIRHSLIREV